MPKQPTQRQIQEARDYILQRIDAQHLLESQLEIEFEEAATRIAAIILKYKNLGFRLHFTGNSQMSSEIQEVIEWLRSQIDYYVDYYAIPEEATDDEEQEQMILAYIDEPLHGHTYHDRETLYLSNYIKSLASTNFDSYFDEDEIIEAINEAVEKPHNRLSLLALNTVAVGFAFYLHNQATANGAIGFYVYPGSSNPCQYCTDQHFRFHPMDEYPYGGIFHPRCYCYFVFVYSN